MSLRRICLAIIFVLLGAAQLVSAENIRVAIVDFTLTEQSRKDAPVPFLDQVNEALRLGFENSPDFELIPDREVRREYEPLIARYRVQDDPLLFSLGRQLRADYVVTGRLSTENPNTFQVAARMLDIRGNRILLPISFEGTRRLGNTLMGNLVVRVASSLRQNFTPGQKSGMTEIAIDLESMSSVPEMQNQADSGRVFSLSAIVYGGASFDSKFSSMSSLAGLDLILDIERTHFSFGIGGVVLGQLTVDGSLFLEAHLYENNQAANWQMYFRAGAGFVYPIDPRWEKGYKVSALVGARYIASNFVFDLGLGIDYYSSQRSAFCLRTGIGVHL
ncbi:MAG: hypothetical protein LBC99_01815 [Spirochaetota bacterium]|jgi:hypothetical protein|nr:hypothetical protein [Spirochaetota bacterium]